MTPYYQRHEPDVRAPQWEKQWCVVDNEDWPCAVERRQRIAQALAPLRTNRLQIEEALQAERDTSEGNPYSPAKAAGFVYLWIKSRQP